MHDIFISYSRKNFGQVRAIKDELERLGFACWMDLEDIPAGDVNYKKRIIPAIRALRGAFLFFLTAESQESPNAWEELRFAQHLAKRIVLVRINDDDMTTNFFFWFEDADIFDWRDPEQRKKLIQELRSWAGKPDNGKELPKSEQHIATITSCNSGNKVEIEIMHDIFISYSRKNLDLVKPIRDELEKHGFRCWMDLEGIHSDAPNFVSRIIPAIQATRVCFLFFLTAESQASEWAIREISFANNRANKRIVLVQINDDKMTDEFYFIYQFTNIRDWRKSEQKEALLKDLKKWLAEAGGTGNVGVAVRSSGVSIDQKPQVPECAKCGRLLTASVDQFKCQRCGKHYCLVHQDPDTWLCGECAYAQRRVEQVMRELKGKTATVKTTGHGGILQNTGVPEWCVELVASGPKKICVIVELRSFTGLGLKEARDLVESAPVIVKENVSRDEAERFKRQLEAIGARVRIIRGGSTE